MITIGWRFICASAALRLSSESKLTRTLGHPLGLYFLPEEINSISRGKLYGRWSRVSKCKVCYWDVESGRAYLYVSYTMEATELFVDQIPRGKCPRKTKV